MKKNITNIALSSILGMALVLTPMTNTLTQTIPNIKPMSISVYAHPNEEVELSLEKKIQIEQSKVPLINKEKLKKAIDTYFETNNAKRTREQMKYQNKPYYFSEGITYKVKPKYKNGGIPKEVLLKNSLQYAYKPHLDDTTWLNRDGGVKRSIGPLEKSVEGTGFSVSGEYGYHIAPIYMSKYRPKLTKQQIEESNKRNPLNYTDNFKLSRLINLEWEKGKIKSTIDDLYENTGDGMYFILTKEAYNLVKNDKYFFKTSHNDMNLPEWVTQPVVNEEMRTFVFEGKNYFILDDGRSYLDPRDNKIKVVDYYILPPIKEGVDLEETYQGDDYTISSRFLTEELGYDIFQYVCSLGYRLDIDHIRYMFENNKLPDWHFIGLYKLNAEKEMIRTNSKDKFIFPEFASPNPPKKAK